MSKHSFAMNLWKFSKRFLICSGALACLKNFKNSIILTKFEISRKFEIFEHAEYLKKNRILGEFENFDKIFSSDDEKTKDDYVQKLSTSISDSIKDYCKKELQSFKSKVRKSAGKNSQHAEQFITLIDQGRISISPVKWGASSRWSVVVLPQM